MNTIVAEYISYGEPVGSRTVVKRGGIGLSAASVRNIMSDLTELGYIMQPHTSAGRVPTDMGYRFYVDGVLASRIPASADDRSAIEGLILTGGIDVREILRKSSSVLAWLSKKAGLVAAGLAPQHRIKTIEFMKLAEDRIVVVLVATGDLVQNRLIYDEDPVSQETLDRYSRMLNDMLKDLDLRQAREKMELELALEKTMMDAILSKVLRIGHTIVCQEAAREIFIEGQSNMLDEPEFLQVERLKALIATFEEKSNLLRILDKTLEAHDIQIFIGSEHGLDEIETCAIVASPVRAEGAAVAGVGVIGPKRMDYRRVVSVVEATVGVLTKVFRRHVETGL